jgi:HEAT repeat protein
MNALLLCTALVSAANPNLATALSGRHNAISILQLQALASDPVADLITVANDATAMVYVRARAAAMLGLFDDTRVQTALTALLTHPEVTIRVQSVRALGKVAARATPAVGQTLTQAIAASLSDADLSVRMQTARTLSVLPNTDALLAKQLRVEQAPELIDLIVDQLAR